MKSNEVCTKHEWNPWATQDPCQPKIPVIPRSQSSQDPIQPKIPVSLRSQSAQEPSQHWMPSCLFGSCLFGIWLMLLNFSSIYYIPTWILVMHIWHIHIFPSLKNHMSQGPAVELLLARPEVKWLLIHLRACRYIWTKIGLLLKMVNNLQITLNI